MGYTIEQGETKFFISKDNIEELIERIGMNAEEFEDDWCIDSWNYIINFANGDCVGIDFTGEKLGSDYEMFCKLAPIVRDDSFITIHGEDGDVWRWIFKDGHCKEVHAKLSFDE